LGSRRDNAHAVGMKDRRRTKGVVFNGVSLQVTRYRTNREWLR